MNVILFDYQREAFFPLTFTRPIADLRIGIVTIKQKWEFYYNNVSVKTEDYLQEKFLIHLSEENLWINAQALPNKDLVDEINNLNEGELLARNETPIAFKAEQFEFDRHIRKEINADCQLFENNCDIFTLNGEEIKNDFERITKERISQKLDESSIKVGNYPLFIEEGAKIERAYINCNEGPIYIGRNAEMMECCVVRGPFAMGEGAVLKIGAKIYSNTTIGPFSKVGGEVNNVVFMGYSNKGHDGFLGNAVIGEWCNFGAGSNNSNLKNNYAEVKLWDYRTERFQNTGLQFCGLIMGDYSKCGINSMFNTGTVVGVSANIFGSGFPRNFVPSFSWGGASGFSSYKTEKAFEVADKVMQRRNKSFNEVEKKILSRVFELTKPYRNEK